MVIVACVQMCTRTNPFWIAHLMPEQCKLGQTKQREIKLRKLYKLFVTCRRSKNLFKMLENVQVDTGHTETIQFTLNVIQWYRMWVSLNGKSHALRIVVFFYLTTTRTTTLDLSLCVSTALSETKWCIRYFVCLNVHGIFINIIRLQMFIHLIWCHLVFGTLYVFLAISIGFSSGIFLSH